MGEPEPAGPGPDKAGPGEAGPATAAAEPAGTGDPRVDAALQHLRALGDQPVSAHPPIFERVHGQLVEVLGELRADADPAVPRMLAAG